MASNQLANSISDLSLEEDIEKLVERLYDNPKLYGSDGKYIAARVEKEAPDYLRKKVNTDIVGTLAVIEVTCSPQLATSTISEESKPRYFSSLYEQVKLRGEDESLLNLIYMFTATLDFNLHDAEPLLSLVIPFIGSSKTALLNVVHIIKTFKEEAHPFLEKQLVILTLKEEFVVSFKLVSIILTADTKFGVEMFRIDSLQNLLLKINSNGSSVSLKIIKAALSLLSDACGSAELRDFIVEKYLDILVYALRSSETTEVQILAGLVLLKTWKLEALAGKGIQIDNLSDVFTQKLTESSLEGLTYLMLRDTIRIKLRKDEHFIFDLLALFLEEEETSSTSSYGLMVILSRLSSVPQRDELSDLKKEAQKHIDGFAEEDPKEINEFRSELVERRVVEKLSKVRQSTDLVTGELLKLMNNLCQRKELHTDIIKQGGLHLIMKSIGIARTIEIRKPGLNALALLLASSDPKLVFSKDSPTTAFNYLFTILLPEGAFSVNEQNLALVALTNLALLEAIESLSAKKWEIIDSYLLSENVYLRRSTIELVSNLMQHHHNLVALFNFENSASKKRFEIISKYTQLEDVKSQSAALTALTLGVTIDFISEEMVKDSKVTQYCTSILSEQLEQSGVVERALFILYYIVFHSLQGNGKVIRELKTQRTLKKSLIEIATHGRKFDGEAVEMALEIAKIVNFE